MTPDPVAGGTRTEGDSNVSQVWLDALARGSCDEEGFLRAIQMLTRRSPEAAWDSLALLDQYYRRGKIRAEVFKRVKSRLGAQLLGPALGELSVPLKRQGKTSAVMVPVPPTATPPTATPPTATPPAATPPAATPSAAVPPSATQPAATQPSAAPPAAARSAAAPSAAAPPTAARPAAARAGRSSPGRSSPGRSSPGRSSPGRSDARACAAIFPGDSRRIGARPRYPCGAGDSAGLVGGVPAQPDEFSVLGSSRAFPAWSLERPNGADRSRKVRPDIECGQSTRRRGQARQSAGCNRGRRVA